MIKLIQRFMNTANVQKEWVLGLFILLFCIRLYHLTGPIVDRHSWNQISAAAMAKSIAQDWKYITTPTVDLFRSLHDLSRTYAQEFPLYHIPIALIYQITGVCEWPARMVSIIYGMIGLGYWFLLCRQVWGDRIAWITTLIAGFSSLNWFYDRTIMSDTSMVTAMIAGCYHFYQWLETKNNRQLWASCLWTAAAGLFKPFGLIIGGTYLLLILFRKSYELFKDLKLYVFVILVWLPTVLWILHVVNLPEGTTEFTGVKSMGQIRSPELLLTWDFYYRLIFVRLIDAGLTPWAGLFAVIGISATRLKDPRFHVPLAWLLSCVVYALIVQNGNYVHEYYQLPFIPGLALFAAIGVDRFWQWDKIAPRYRSLLLGIFLILMILHNSVYFWRYSRYDIGSYNTGRKIAELSQDPQETVLAFDMGVNKWNQLIFYSNHYGWYHDTKMRPFTLEELELFQQQGADWLGVNLTYETHYKQYEPLLRELEKRYPKVWEDLHSSDRYGLRVVSQVYDLRQPLTP
ncbi:glycosyltransferase family 39 protein [Deltaproteobacteria bacterium TL4]